MTGLRAFGASARQARHRVRASGASARQGRPHTALIVAALFLPFVACGKKGPPLAPFHPVPAAVTELSARRVGPEMRIRFTLPTQNVSGTERIDLEAVDVYAVTVAPGGIVPPTKELLTRKYLVTSIAVRPQPIEEEAPGEPEPGEPGKARPQEQKAAEQKPPSKPEPRDERPLPGERVTFVEALTEAQLTPAIVAKPPVLGKGVPPVVPAVLDPPVVTRFYVVRGRSHRGAPGAQSTRVVLPLVPEPEAPSAVKADVTETALTFSWTPPPAVVDPVAAEQNAQAWAAVNAPPPPPAPVAKTRTGPETPAAPTFDPSQLAPLTRLPGVQLPATVILPLAPRFNVYAVKNGAIEDTPINPTPLTTPAYAAGEPAWNEETCFVVRTVRAYGLVSIESSTAQPTCVTPTDKFPPAAPVRLKAVAAEGAMNLIWDANSERDLAGYLVLRGEVPGDTLQPLTPAPIGETNYTDTTVKPGVRYVYVIVAVDKASPPNMSAQSNRVEEVAR